MEYINKDNKLEKLEYTLPKNESDFRTRRDELIFRLTKGINLLRVGTEYKPTSLKLVALRANRNPFLKSDDELEYLISCCEVKKNYSYFFWLTK
jgi:hypothetical protein